MILTVTLARDSTARLVSFATDNLAQGSDHVLVLLDEDPEGSAPHLNAIPGVTAHVLDDDWWGPRGRAASLNARQRVAANAGLACAVVHGGFDWVFFLDADEVLSFDPEELALVPAATPACRLRPLELVVTPDGIAHGTYKRLLQGPGLRELAGAGVIESASNRALFRGHVTGKIGVRPDLGTRFLVHNAVGADDRDLPRHDVAGINHLHLETTSYEAFVAKWTALLGSGPAPAMRGRRARIWEAMAAAERMAPDARDLARRTAYEELSLDHPRLLEHPRAVTKRQIRTYSPARVRGDAGQVHAAMSDLVARLAQIDKDAFLRSAPRELLSTHLRSL